MDITIISHHVIGINVLQYWVSILNGKYDTTFGSNKLILLQSTTNQTCFYMS